MVKKIKKELDFEQAMQELESLVEKMEEGDIKLEESLATFERGVELTRICQQTLKSAEQKVQILLEKNGQTSHETFDSSDH